MARPHRGGAGASTATSGVVPTPVVGSLVVFTLTYLIIASRQLRFLGLDRPAGAIVGAVTMARTG